MKPTIKLLLNKTVIFLLFVGCWSKTLGQDVIHTTQGDSFSCLIQRIGADSVSFKPMSSIVKAVSSKVKPIVTKGKTIMSIEKNRIDHIKYENGVVENYSALKNSNYNFLDNGKQGGLVDTIYEVDGEKLAVRINEVEDYFVIFSNPLSRIVDKIEKFRISKIRYSNGFQVEYPNSTDEIGGAAEFSGNLAKGSGFRVLSISELGRLNRFSSLETALSQADNVGFLDLSNQGMKEVSGKIQSFKNLIALDLRRNELKDFPLDILTLTKLQYVWLDDNEIKNTKIDKKNIDQMRASHVVFISLNGNRLNKLHTAVFQFGNLSELSANENHISEFITDKGFSPQKCMLKKLGLRGNVIEKFPLELKDYPYLSLLDLSNNKIKEIKRLTAGWLALKALNLNNNPIGALDNSLYHLLQLESLNLSQTKITSLPNDISKVSDLHKLILPGCFHDFPSDFIKLNALNELHIGNDPNNGARNDLTIPSAVYSCIGLKTLEISGVSLKSLSPNIVYLRSLTELALTDCNLTSVPKEIFGLNNLKVLDLGNNNIVDIPPPIGELHSLEILNLRNSPLNASTLVRLKRAAPTATITYFDVDLGLNFVSQPVPVKMLPTFRQCLKLCDQKPDQGFYRLGDYFRDRNDVGCAIKAYRTVAENVSLEGTALALSCSMAIAEIYDDRDGLMKYESPFKRRRFSNFNEYTKSGQNNRALSIYLAVNNIRPKDDAASAIIKKAGARAVVIYNEMANELETLYEQNRARLDKVSGRKSARNIKVSDTQKQSESLRIEIRNLRTKASSLAMKL